MSVAQRNKSESPTGMEPVTSQTSGGMGYVAFSVCTYMYMDMILSKIMILTAGRHIPPQTVHVSPVF